MLNEEFVLLYEDALYRESFLATLRSLKNGVHAEKIVYLIKNIITRDSFQIVNKGQIKILVFYYFYLLGKVEFTNGYEILFKRERLTIDFPSLCNIENLFPSNFSQFFDLGKNEVFLNKIIDTTLVDSYKHTNSEVIEVSTLLDFFTVFLHENLELYSLEGEHFPLFKWLINQLQENYNC